MKTRWTLGWAALFCTLGSAQYAAAQHTVFQYQVDVSVNNLVDTAVNYELGPGPIDLSLTDPGIGTAQGLAYVGMGVNKAHSQIHSDNPDNPIWLSYSLATAQWWDTVTISDPLLNGTPGTFSTRMFVEGSGFFNVSPSWLGNPDVVDVSAQWLATVSVVGSDSVGVEHSWYGSWGQWFPDQGLQYVGDPLNSYERVVTFPFTYGESFSLGGFLQTYVNVQNYNEFVPGSIDASLDLGNSAYWGGMTAIRDFRGRRNPRAQLTSRSGINWRQSLAPRNVPEPSAWALAVTGALALAMVQRRRASV